MVRRTKRLKRLRREAEELHNAIEAYLRGLKREDL
jgi:Flp pilus assembly protein TadB